MFFKNKIKLFDKSDIYYCAKNAVNKTYTEFIKDHTLMYIYTGELIVRNNDDTYEFHAHECVFLKRGSYVMTTTRSNKGEKFSAVYIRLRKCFLKDFLKELVIKPEYNDISILTSEVTKVSCTPDIESLFISMEPYIERNVQPTPVATNMKMKAGIFSLLNMQAGFYSILFDFSKKWTFPWIELL